MLVGSLVGEKAQSGENPLPGRFVADPTVVRGNTIGRKTKTRGCNAGDSILRQLLLIFAVV